MGAVQSLGKLYEQVKHFGSLYVKMDKPYYNPGDQITGTVYLSLNIPYPGESLYVELKAAESFKYVEEIEKMDQNNQPYTEYKLNQEKIVIMDLRLPIYTANGGFLPGQYAFPFSFLLPQGLPGSFYQEAPMAVAEIEYKLHAVLTTYIKAPMLKYKEKLIVNENVKSAVGNAHLSNTVEVKTCCCFDKGATKVTAQFEKNFLTPGETGKNGLQC